MKALLDTQIFLWWITADSRLSHKVRELVANTANELFVSAASGWEMAIKARLGKLKLPADPATFVAKQLALNAIKSLPVEMGHALRVYSLPKYHRDPFDRLLVAQAQIEGLSIVTADAQIARYPVKCIW